MLQRYVARVREFRICSHLLAIHCSFRELLSIAHFIHQNDLDNVLDKFIDDLELDAHQHKRVSECSGGNKRRVSVAVSFMGNPDVVLMDEPSSGTRHKGHKIIRTKTIYTQIMTAICYP